MIKLNALLRYVYSSIQSSNALSFMLPSERAKQARMISSFVQSFGMPLISRNKSIAIMPVRLLPSMNG